MMSETDSNADSHSKDNVSDKSNNTPSDSNADFGALLREARKAKNYTIAEICEHIKIPVHAISALESNDLEALPAATFTLGYIRAYVKFLNMPEHEVLALYNRAAPQSDIHELKPRSYLPGEASSQSPLIKIITLVLMVAGIVALGFGGYQYYQQKATQIGTERDSQQVEFSGISQDSANQKTVDIKPNTASQKDDEIISQVTELQPPLEQQPLKQQRHEEQPLEQQNVVPSGSDTAAMEPTDSLAATTDELSKDSVEISREPARDNIAAQENIAQSSAGAEESRDSIEIIAENGAWVEVRDANHARLHYNMLPVGGSKVMIGRAPFSVTMGNAKTTKVRVNDLDVDISRFIRSSNTVSFKVSTQQQNIIFH